jgi:hypothetical protein
MRSEVRTRLNTILARDITPLLGSRQFRRHKYLYQNIRADLSWLIDVQFDVAQDRLKYTFNCGVFVPGLMELYLGPAFAARTPQIHTCCVTARVGNLTDDRLDKWWTLLGGECADVNDHNIGLDARRNLEAYVVPFLHRFESRENVTTFLRVTPQTAQDRLVSPRSDAIRHAYAAIIFFQMSNFEEARREIGEALTRSAGGPAESTMIGLSRRLDQMMSAD